MLVREFTPVDKEQYFTFSKQFYASKATLVKCSEKQLESTFQQIMEHSPYLRGLMIEDGGAMIGYALLAFYWCCESGGMVVLLDELFVCEAYRGRQIGSQFLHWLVEEYQDLGYSFSLEVSPKNKRVEKLYEKYGFKEDRYIQMTRACRS